MWSTRCQRETRGYLQQLSNSESYSVSRSLIPDTHLPSSPPSHPLLNTTLLILHHHHHHHPLHHHHHNHYHHPHDRIMIMIIITIIIIMIIIIITIIVIIIILLCILHDHLCSISCYIIIKNIFQNQRQLLVYLALFLEYLLFKPDVLFKVPESCQHCKFALLPQITNLKIQQVSSTETLNTCTASFMLYCSTTLQKNSMLLQQTKCLGNIEIFAKKLHKAHIYV